MEYKSLKSIYFSNKKEYDKEYLYRFNNPSAIKFNFKVKENQCFAVITPELLNKLYTIVTLNNTLNITSQKLPEIALDQYIKKCLIDEIVLTNEIEGVISTRKDIFEILESVEYKDKHKRLLGLVSKYNKLNKREQLSIKTCQDIRDIYDELVLEEILTDNPENAPDGKYFRKNSVNVVSQFNKVIHTGTMPEERLNSEMEEALNILNDESINVLIRTAVFHYLFGYIHPFYDGNGRTNRFISSYVLSTNLNVLTGYRLAYTIKENISTSPSGSVTFQAKSRTSSHFASHGLYYNSFKNANDNKNKGDLTPFINNFFDILISLLQKLIDSVNKRFIRLKQYRDISYDLFKNNEKYSNIAFILFQQSLFGESGISAETIVKASDSSMYAVRKCIAELNEKELIIISKLGKKYLYKMNLDKF